MLLGGELLFAQTLKELETDFQVARGTAESEAQPVLSLFTILLLAAVLLAVAAVFLGVRFAGQREERRAPVEGEGEQDSYFLHVAFLVAGYAAILFMFSNVPAALTPGLGTTTRWVLMAAAIVICGAHILAARDERALPPSLKLVFSGGVILAAGFFHLTFKKWSFLHFSDPFYHGIGPYVALGCIIMLVLAYSAYIAVKHFHKPGD
jgi:hypothetical protein